MAKALATNYIYHGATLIDVHGSDADAETLEWGLKGSPYRDSLAIVAGDTMKVETEFPVLRIGQFNCALAEKYQVVITDKMFFEGREDHYYSLARIFEMVKNRRGWKRPPSQGGNKIMVLLVREARKVIRAQLVSQMSTQEQQAQWEFVDLNAQREHNGVAPIVDSQLYMDVHHTFRSLATFKVCKGFGGQQVPDELSWWFKPWLFGRAPQYLRTMPIDEFVCSTRWNGVCRGLVGDIPWAIEKGKDLAHALNISVEREGRRGGVLTGADLSGLRVRTHAGETLARHVRMKELKDAGNSAQEIARFMSEEPGWGVVTYWSVVNHLAGRCSCAAQEAKARGA